MLPMTVPTSLRRARATRPAAAVAAGALCVALLTACTGGSDDPAEPAPSGTTATSDSTPTDGATDGTLTAQETCTTMYVDGDEPLERRVVSALVGISKGTDTDTVGSMTAVGIELGALSAKAPEEFSAAIAKVREPFLQLQENLDAGTEETVLDIRSAHEGLSEMRELCGTADGASGA